jgi:hypothetical protein
MENFERRRHRLIDEVVESEQVIAQFAEDDDPVRPRHPAFDPLVRRDHFTW